MFVFRKIFSKNFDRESHEVASFEIRPVALLPTHYVYTYIFSAIGNGDRSSFSTYIFKFQYQEKIKDKKS